MIDTSEAVVGKVLCISVHDTELLRWISIDTMWCLCPFCKVISRDAWRGNVCFYVPYQGRVIEHSSSGSKRIFIYSSSKQSSSK